MLTDPAEIAAPMISCAASTGADPASHPGGGVLGACGRNAAEEILRDG